MIAMKFNMIRKKVCPRCLESTMLLVSYCLTSAVARVVIFLVLRGLVELFMEKLAPS